jgi:hypothetical protein
VATHIIESIYVQQYEQQVRVPEPAERRFQLKAFSEVVDAELKQDKVRLIIKNPKTGQASISDHFFDVVIVASGYKPSSAKALLSPAAHLFDEWELNVGSDYCVDFGRDVLAPSGSLWILSSQKNPKSRSDDFAGIAETARRVTQSVVRGTQRTHEVEVKTGKTTEVTLR